MINTISGETSILATRILQIEMWLFDMNVQEKWRTHTVLFSNNPNAEIMDANTQKNT